MARLTTSYSAKGGKLAPAKGKKPSEMGTFKFNIPRNCRRNEHDDHDSYRIGCSRSFGWCYLCAHQKGDNVVTLNIPGHGAREVKVCDEHMAELETENAEATV